MAEVAADIPEHALLFLTPEEQDVLLPLARTVSVAKSEALFRAGETAEGIYFLETGRLGVLKPTGFNDRTQVVALLEPGASVGEAGVLDDICHAATIVAIEDSRLFYVDRQALADLGRRDSPLLVKILKRLLYAANLRLQKSSERLAHIL